MPRYKLTIEYDGTAYCGFQRQTTGPSVQEVLEKALQKLTQQEIIVYVAGRTDAGVHALGQVCHVELPRAFEGETLVRALNFYLQDEPVVVCEAREVPAIFHARFSAIKRHYLYRVYNCLVPPAIKRQYVWHVRKPLNVQHMQDAAQHLVGHHDFTTFRASYCQAKSAVRTLDSFDIAVVEDEIHFRVAARSFLHHQVRNMVGALYWVGQGRWTAADIAAVLQEKDRTKSGPTVPAQGLFLVKVEYPPDSALPSWSQPVTPTANEV